MIRERGTCPLCGQSAMLSEKDGRTLLSHSTRWKHLDGCPTSDKPSGFCESCGFAVYKDRRGCRGAGRVAVEKRKGKA